MKELSNIVTNITDTILKKWPSTLAKENKAETLDDNRVFRVMREEIRPKGTVKKNDTLRSLMFFHT